MEINLITVIFINILQNISQSQFSFFKTLYHNNDKNNSLDFFILDILFMFASSVSRSTSRIIKNAGNAKRFYLRMVLRESPLSHEKWRRIDLGDRHGISK